MELNYFLFQSENGYCFIVNDKDINFNHLLNDKQLKKFKLSVYGSYYVIDNSQYTYVHCG